MGSHQRPPVPDAVAGHLETREGGPLGAGTPKKGDDLEIAEDIRKWKETTRAAQLFTYQPDEGKLEGWKSKMKEYKTAITTAEREYQKVRDLYTKGETTAGAVAEARKAVFKAKQNFDAWAKTNVRRSIDPEWYKERREILDAVSEIQDKYKEQFEEMNIDMRTSSEVWDEIFNILKGYRNADGVYVGTNIPQDLSKRIKELQLELQKIREAYKKAKLVSKEDKEDLDELFAQLESIQKRQTTEYYKDAYNNALGQVRATVITDYMRLNPKLVLNYKEYLREATTQAEREFPGFRSKILRSTEILG